MYRIRGCVTSSFLMKIKIKEKTFFQIVVLKLVEKLAAHKVFFCCLLLVSNSTDPKACNIRSVKSESFSA